MTGHRSADITDTPTGFHVAHCACGWRSAPFVSDEEPIDALMDHAAAMARVEVLDEWEASDSIGRLADQVTRKFLIDVDSVASLVAHRGLDDEAREDLRAISIEARTRLKTWKGIPSA